MAGAKRWKLCVGALVSLGLAGCAGSATTSGGAQSSMTPGDPAARHFAGTIVSLRYMSSTMLVSKDEHVGRDAFPNIIEVKYDAQTKFYLDDAPTTLDKIEQYMPVTVEGHMRDRRLYADAARFSSVLPANVRRAAQGPGQSTP
jgi:hypothetical protein